MNYWVFGYSVLFLSVVINCIHIAYNGIKINLMIVAVKRLKLKYPFKSTSNYHLPILQSYEGEKSADSNILQHTPTYSNILQHTP